MRGSERAPTTDLSSTRSYDLASTGIKERGYRARDLLEGGGKKRKFEYAVSRYTVLRDVDAVRSSAARLIEALLPRPLLSVLRDATQGGESSKIDFYTGDRLR